MNYADDANILFPIHYKNSIYFPYIKSTRSPIYSCEDLSIDYSSLDAALSVHIVFTVLLYSSMSSFFSILSLAISSICTFFFEYFFMLYFVTKNVLGCGWKGINMGIPPIGYIGMSRSEHMIMIIGFQIHSKKDSLCKIYYQPSS